MKGTDETKEPLLLSGAYALHALSDDEVRTVEEAAAQSEELRGELAGLTDTAVLLGLSVPQEAPPAALRARLLDAVDLVAQLPPLPVREEPLAGGAHVATGRRRRRRRPAMWVAAATAAVLLFGGGIAIDRIVQAPQTEYAAINAAVDTHRATVAVTGGGTATVAWSAEQNATSVVLDGVRAPSGRVLQLWSLHGSTATSEGLYESGDAFRLIDGTPKTGEKLAITIEPAGGSKQPTTAPIASVALT